MNLQKILSIILMICGVGVIIIGFSLASGENTSNNIVTGVLGIGMLLFGIFLFSKKRG